MKEVEDIVAKGKIERLDQFLLLSERRLWTHLGKIIETVNEGIITEKKRWKYCC